MEVLFEKFVYQVVVQEHAVLVFTDEPAAKRYVADYLKGQDVLVLPIAIFDYCEVVRRSET